MLVGDPQVPLLSTSAFPPLSTATQKLAVGHDTELIESASMLLGKLHVPLAYVTTLPEESVATHELVDTHEIASKIPKPGSTLVPDDHDPAIADAGASSRIRTTKAPASHAVVELER
jgi:hypothetical protein